jgi:PKHD-type hydroxylase
MILQDYYWFYKSVIPKRICDQIIRYGNDQREHTALIGDNTNKSHTDIELVKKKRNSHIAWLNDPWIYREIQPYVEDANVRANWNFDIDYAETIQFTKYKHDQYYDWHCDGWYHTYNKPEDPAMHGKIRKVSMIVSLSEPTDYEGGQLEFDPRNADHDTGRNILECKEIRPKGSVVVFPSFVWHRVKPVTQGLRYSLVVWNIGYPFK